MPHALPTVVENQAQLTCTHAAASRFEKTCRSTTEEGLSRPHNLDSMAFVGSLGTNPEEQEHPGPKAGVTDC